MRIGIDIVDIDRIKKIVLQTPTYIERMLYMEESASGSIESICGKIAAKEAIMKTGFIRPGEWKKIMIKTLDCGAPIVCDDAGLPVSAIQISISHAHHQAVAVALYDAPIT